MTFWHSMIAAFAMGMTARFFAAGFASLIREIVDSVRSL